MQQLAGTLKPHVLHRLCQGDWCIRIHPSILPSIPILKVSLYTQHIPLPNFIPRKTNQRSQCVSVEFWDCIPRIFLCAVTGVGSLFRGPVCAAFISCGIFADKTVATGNVFSFPNRWFKCTIESLTASLFFVCLSSRNCLWKLSRRKVFEILFVNF